MVPLILDKDRPIVKKAPHYKTNDIVVFTKNKNLIAHRLIYLSLKKNYFIAKGDNNLKSDGKTAFDHILGKTEAVRRNGQLIRLSHVYLTQSANYLKELTKVNKLFLQKHIPYIVLKGLPLHLHLNHSSPKRLYFDADFLIKRKYFKEVDGLFVKLGFKKLDSVLLDKKVADPSQITYIKITKSFPVVIDLHLEPAIGFTKLKGPNRLLPKTKKFNNYLFENRRGVQINGERFSMLNNEALTIYLLLHFFHHNFNGIHRLEFINDLIKKQKIDWGEVASQINRFKFNNFIFPVVLMLKKYYQTPFPEEFVDKVRPFASQKFLSLLTASIVFPFDSGTRVQEGVKRLVFLFFLSPSSLAQKIGVVAEKEVIGHFLSIIKSFFFKRPTNFS